MKTFETMANVGPDGVLTLEHLPFPAGKPVRVRIEDAQPETGKEPATPPLDVSKLHPDIAAMIGLVPSSWDAREVYLEHILKKHG